MFYSTQTYWYSFITSSVCKTK